MATISGPRYPRQPSGQATALPQTAHTTRESSRTAAIGKTMILYEALRSTPEALRLSDLSRRTGLAKSTTHRLLTALIASGMVTRLGVGYIVVHRPADAVRVSDRQRDQLRRLAPFVCDAVIRTRCTSSLATLDGPDVVFAHRVYSHENVPTSSDFSGRERVHLTAAGLLLLSCDLRAACGAAREWGLDAEETARLDGELISIRRRGYAMRATAELICAAVPLPVNPDGPPIVLAAKGRGKVSDAEHLVVQLRAVATSVRAALNAAGTESAPTPRMRSRTMRPGAVRGSETRSAPPEGRYPRFGLGAS